MAAPTACCGFECGAPSVATPLHMSGVTGSVSISTSVFRSGLRAGRINPTASQAYFARNLGSGVRTVVQRFYRRFDTHPAANVVVAGVFRNSDNFAFGLAYQSSDGKYYAGSDDGTTFAVGATGVSITAGDGVWHLIEIRTNATANPHLIDVSIDGVVLGQHSKAVAAADLFEVRLGNTSRSVSYDFYDDDYLESQTSGDYPLGPGYVLSYIPNADGTHNVAGAADFKHGTGTTPAGADITNASTDAWQDIDKRPLVTSAAGAETLINMIAPPNATDYVEVQFEDSVEPAPPRAVEVIIGINQAGTGAGNMEVRLNDNDTMGTVYTATAVAGVTIATGVVFKRAHFADPPSAATAWVLGGAGDGDFNDLRIRFGSPAAVDANPDQYLVEVMFEAEYQPALPQALYGRPFGQPGVKLMPQLLAT